jgi:hypothetical protein
LAKKQKLFCKSVGGIFILIAPLTLYGIYTRLGETNRLLQRLADASLTPSPRAENPDARLFRTLG